jgi:uncharacterized membrane protein YdbT with pleckstrin-like domain
MLPATGAFVSYIDKNLVSGEKLLYTTRLHWIVLVRPLVIGLLLLAGGVGLLVGDYQGGIQGAARKAMLIGGIVLVVLAAILVFSGFIRRNATEVAVTNMRVLIKTGLVERRSVEVLLAKVESINVAEPALGRILGYGSVIIRGTGGTFETFQLIARPNEFRRQVQQQIGAHA